MKNHYDSTYTIKAVDAYALGYALADTSEIENVRIEKQEDGEYKLRFRYSHYAMNGQGCHVGYENVDFYLPCHKKVDFAIHGAPWALSQFIVFWDELMIENVDCPDEELPTRESHEDDCEVQFVGYDNWDWNEDPWPEHCDCGLNDNWDGYFQPDWDYFYDTLDGIFYHIEHYNQLPKFEFDENAREWSIGERCYCIDTPEKFPEIEWEF
jgi:hypothetical protein